LTKPVCVLGAGGHAKVVISTLLVSGYTVEAVYDDNPERWGSQLMGVPIMGPIESLVDHREMVAVIAIGDNSVRQRVASKFLHVTWLAIVHPRAWVDPTAKLGPGTVVFAGAVVQPETQVGAHVIINTGATVDHDCRLGDWVHVAPGTHLAGEVQLEEGVFVGIGGSIIPGCRVGRWTTIGAGATVVRDLPDHVVAMGVPARPIRRTI
jgi:sugar O-acyltransferase (sialic acid O-acetyltransferase NeuD family)